MKYIHILYRSLKKYDYIIWMYWLILYKYSLFGFLKARFLIKDGIKFIKKGKIKEIPKHIKVFIIRKIWVFWYTAQNEDK